MLNIERKENFIISASGGFDIRYSIFISPTLSSNSQYSFPMWFEPLNPACGVVLWGRSPKGEAPSAEREAPNLFLYWPFWNKWYWFHILHFSFTIWNQLNKINPYIGSRRLRELWTSWSASVFKTENWAWPIWSIVPVWTKQPSSAWFPTLPPAVISSGSPNPKSIS